MSRRSATTRDTYAGTRRRLNTGVSSSTGPAGAGAGWAGAGATAGPPRATRQNASTVRARMRIGEARVDGGGVEPGPGWGVGRVLGDPAGCQAGIKEGSVVALLGTPDGFEAELEPLADVVRLGRRLRPGIDVAGHST